MRLTTALNEYKDHREDRFPEEIRTTSGAFSGHGDRLVHVSPSGSLRDYSAPLSGLNGIDRSRLGIETPDRTYWLEDLQIIRQHYYRETRLVETEFDADEFTVHQFDLTLGRAHVTHVELRGSVPDDASLVAFLTMAPEGRDASVGALIHEEAGPNGSQALEVFHRREHDYVTASTGLDDVRGQRPEQFEEILDEAPVSFPRGGVEPYDETRLSGNFVVSAPLTREGRGARTTLVSQLSDHEEIDRGTALADLRSCATQYADADAIRAAARERTTVEVPDDAPRPALLRADLRVLDLLQGAVGGHVAAPEFDPFYANSGGYGYVWFRDDANVARRLLATGERLDLDVREKLFDVAEFYCDAQLADGTWPHRVWATDGSLAPGWANANVERKAGSSEYQADQTAAATAFLARLLSAYGMAIPASLRGSISTTVAAAVDAMTEGLAENGLPERCQNVWENAVGQFTHTAATYVEALAIVSASPVDDRVAATARDGAATVLDALDSLWDDDLERYGMRLLDGDLDDRLDASTLALAEAAVAVDDVAGIELPNTQLDRILTHVETVLTDLRREPPDGDVAGLVRYEDDRWRTAGQVEPKVWSITTAHGAVAAAKLSTLASDRDRDEETLLAAATELYELVGEDGPFTSEAGYLAEQVFDDGTLDSATPIGWAHALRMHATVLLDDADALPVRTEATAPPTERSLWTTGEKYGLGTAADHDSEDPSRVWFTLTEGAVTEPRFPRIDVMNLRTLEYLVRCPGEDYTVRTHAARGETADSVSRRVEPVADDALAYRHVFESTGQHEWTLTVEYATDPAHDALLAECTFEATDGREYDVFAVADVALNNTGTNDRGLRVGAEGAYNLLAREPSAYTTDVEDPLLADENGDAYSVAVAMAARERFDWATVDVAGSAPLKGLFADGELPEPQSSVGDGSIVLVGRLGTGTQVTEAVALGFARRANVAAALGEANGALERGFETVQAEYAQTWHDATADFEVPAAVTEEPALAAQYRTALMSLLAVEDKTYHGASIASPSVPWGQAVTAEENKGYGYNFVWSRDLYQVFTVFRAVGLTEVACAQLAYIYEYQQDDQGFIPQNTYVNGVTRWGGEQMDNISFPQVMAYQLAEEGVTFDDVDYGYENVRRSADYVAYNGPSTAQERWEEEAGYSPSSIATEIAGLTCAGSLAIDEGRSADALVWLALADAWTRDVEAWTASETGTPGHTDTPYYLRVTRDGNPDAGHVRTLANAGPRLDERDIIDAGFLELVRLGIKPHDDPVIENSLLEVDDTIRRDLDDSTAFYRYNGDGYGERATGDPGAPWSDHHKGKGRLWPLLTGERGEYELGGTGTDLTPAGCLRSMERFANSGRMIPEQVWDREHETAYGWEFGEGTGSATPLAWSMAQYVRLALGIDAGQPVETPAVVDDRFRERRLHDSTEGPALSVDAHLAGNELHVAGQSTGAVVAIKTPADAITVRPTDGEFSATVDVPPNENRVIVAAASDEEFVAAATAVRRLSL